MSLTKHGAAHIAAGKLTRTHLDPIAERYVAWIEGKAIETAAIDALMGAADQSKDPDRVLVLAEELYAELDDYPASDGLPDYLQQASLTAAFAGHGEYGTAFTASDVPENLAPVIVEYNPANGVTYTHTGDTAWTDVDATNLKASIVVPPSGKVRVTLTAAATASNGSFHRWGLADVSGDLTESQRGVTNLAAQVVQQHTVTITKDGSGAALTPGKLITLRWRYQISNGANSASIYAGGKGSPTPTGPAVMKLEPVSNRVTAKTVTATLDANAAFIPHDLHPDQKHMIGVAGPDSAELLGRLAYSNDAGGTWATVPNLVTPTGFTKAWYAGDGEILVRAGITGGATPAPGKIHKSSGWATNPATATFHPVLTANNLGGGNDVYFGGYSGDRSWGPISVVSEYGPKNSATDMARYAYVTTDFGDTWRVLFDLYAFIHDLLPAWDGSSAHIHSACYDPYWGCMWVVTGDYNGTVLPYTLVSFDWRSANPTWRTVYSKHQFTSIIPMAGCVLFGTDFGSNAADGYGNGILRLNRVRPESVALEGEAVLDPALIYDTVANQSIVGGGWTRHAWLQDAPTLIPLGETSTSGPAGRIVVTYDGFTFKELWTAPDTGTSGHVGTVVGPVNGKIMAGYQNPTDGYEKEVVTLTLV